MNRAQAPRGDFETIVLEELRAIRETLARLNRGAGPRDEHERLVLEALEQIVGEATFGAGAVLEHGRISAAFQALLDAADIVDTEAVGYLLRGAKGFAFSGRTLHYHGAVRRWQFL